MILRSNEAFQIVRSHRHLQVTLQIPHRVISTCAINGGERLDLNAILNCQTCEGSAHHHEAKNLHRLTRHDLHLKCCHESLLQPPLEPQRTALLGTAANMDYASIQEESYDDAQVTAIATAGVEGNAARAGDPAQWHEGETGYIPVHQTPGTINLILLFHQSVSPAGLARSIVTLTEAKSAALQELSIGSRYSTGLATGTGTDQFAVASPLAESSRFHWTGNHAKLGELVGTAVKKAVLEALRWQNGLETSRTRSLFHALGRFGLREDAVRELLLSNVQSADQKAFLLDSLPMVVHDPRVTATAYAIAALLDRQSAQILPAASIQESIAYQCALMATALSGKPDRFPTLLQEILGQPLEFPAILARTIELGWREKWI